MKVIRHLKKSTIQNLVNSIGWKTNRKIVVIESDDWGSIRTSSKKSYDYFKSKGYEIEKCVYSRYDALESNKDLESLFEVLESVKDFNQNPVKFTANNIVANPDFNKIQENGFEKYYFEPFFETYKRYPEHDRVLSLYQEGLVNKIFYPQFHGREHLNVNRWLHDLKNGNKILKDAFLQGMFTIFKQGNFSGRQNYLDAFGENGRNECVKASDVIESGLKIFKSFWGFDSKSFIAPCYFWSQEIEEILSKNQIEYLQGSHIQKIPNRKDFGFKKKHHFTGEKNKFGQFYLVRNCFFEPSSNPNLDWVSLCLKEVDNAFCWNTPAIICSHRVNYAGFINPKNREISLRHLKNLLFEIKKAFPSVEFLSTVELGEIINGSKR